MVCSCGAVCSSDTVFVKSESLLAVKVSRGTVTLMAGDELNIF